MKMKDWANGLAFKHGIFLFINLFYTKLAEIHSRITGFKQGNTNAAYKMESTIQQNIGSFEVN